MLSCNEGTVSFVHKWSLPARSPLYYSSKSGKETLWGGLVLTESTRSYYWVSNFCLIWVIIAWIWLNLRKRSLYLNTLYSPGCSLSEMGQYVQPTSNHICDLCVIWGYFFVEASISMRTFIEWCSSLPAALGRTWFIAFVRACRVCRLAGPGSQPSSNPDGSFCSAIVIKLHIIKHLPETI